MPDPAPDRRDHEVLLKTTLGDAVKGLAAGRPRAARAAFRLGLMPLARRFRREIEDADELIEDRASLSPRRPPVRTTELVRHVSPRGHRNLAFH